MDVKALSVYTVAPVSSNSSVIRRFILPQRGSQDTTISAPDILCGAAGFEYHVRDRAWAGMFEC
eukprot:7185234-Prymnesium_polylepis.2